MLKGIMIEDLMNEWMNEWKWCIILRVQKLCWGGVVSDCTVLCVFCVVDSEVVHFSF